MRKKLLSILVLTVLVTSALAGCSGDAPSTSSTLTIFSITQGDVFVMKAGTDEWTEATVEMPLQVGDTIKTGDDSGAEITFFDGSTIELEAGTQIEITSLDNSTDTDAKTITLMQTIGTTVSRVTKLLDPASTYAVETPSGVAAVRGSTLIVRIVFDDPNYEDGTVLMTCIEGDIWVIWNGVEVQILEGYTCVIRPDGLLELIPPTEPPQEESGDATDEDTANGESEDQQPGGSATDNLPEPRIHLPDIDIFPPPSNNGNDNNDNEAPPTGGETTGIIHVVTPGTTDALIYVEVETAEGERVWATDLESGLPVDGQHGVSDLITVAGNHHYYVWVGGDGTTYDVTQSHGWTVSDAPDECGGQQADGDLASGDQQNLQFKETG
jgi:hypothetical protein